MKKLLLPGLLALWLLAPQPGYSHGDHGAPPPIAKEAVQNNARDEIKLLIERNYKVEEQLLDPSWLKTGAGKLFKQGPGYYIFSYENPAQKKTLYILMADSGDFYDANFSGKFEGVE